MQSKHLSLFSLFTLLTFFSSKLFATESVAFLSKAATTLTVTGTVYPDTPAGTIIGNFPLIIAQNGGIAKEASVELGVYNGVTLPEVGVFTAYNLTIYLNYGEITVGSFYCAKQNGTNHIIKLPDVITSLDTGETVITQDNYTVDISGLLFDNTTNNLQATIELSGNHVEQSPLQDVEYRGDKIALIAADGREKEYDFSMAGMSGEHLKRLCREVAHSVTDHNLSLCGAANGKVTLQLEVE
jgi:hypothetical protein